MILRFQKSMEVSSVFYKIFTVFWFLRFSVRVK